MVYDAVIYPHAKEGRDAQHSPNPSRKLSPTPLRRRPRCRPKVRELIKRSGKKPVREYTLGEEIFNAVTHGVGAGLAVAALVLLIVKSVADGGGIAFSSGPRVRHRAVAGYLMSTLYHALAAERAKRVFKVLDHSGIYLLIAGTYTCCLITLGHVGGIWLAAFVWAVSLVGIAFEAFWTYSSPLDIGRALRGARLVHRVLHPTLFAELAPAGFWLWLPAASAIPWAPCSTSSKRCVTCTRFSPVRAGRQLPAVLQRVFLRDLALQLGVRGAQGGDSRPQPERSS